MTEKLYRLVYCSRNRIHGSTADVAAQIQRILSSSRQNNSKQGITGALLYNAGNFAQILEGPLEAVCHTFEIIQRDPRHSEVTVVESGRVAERYFADWSMAFNGSHDAMKMPQATAIFDAVFANADGAGGKLLQILKELVVVEDEWILQDAA